MLRIRAMARVPLNLDHHGYEIVIEAGALADLGGRVREVAPHARCGLISDETVYAAHGETARASLQRAGFETTAVVVPPGEAQKNLGTVEQIYRALLADRLERQSPVVALAGGVIGDMAGFVAATYRRGVPFVQVPTTLLAMVDSSVGGKTGFNVPEGKNMIGAFYQPHQVVVDPEVLTTLPSRELRCGLAECVKHAMIRDASLFEWTGSVSKSLLEIDVDVLSELVKRNVEIKAAVVMEDPLEHGVRAHLNFGHTFAHAIEATSGYGEILHGEAVALGMLAATRTAIEAGLCEEGVFSELEATLRALGLATRGALAEDDVLLASMRHDKKVVDDRVRLVLPERVGSVQIRDDLPEACVRAGWAQIRTA